MYSKLPYLMFVVNNKKEHANMPTCDGEYWNVISAPLIAYKIAGVGL